MEKMSGISSTEEEGERKMEEASLHLHVLSSCAVVLGCRTRCGVACECDGAVGSLVTADRGGVMGAVAAVATLTTLLAAEVCTGSVESELRARTTSIEAAERSCDTVDNGWLLLMVIVCLLLL